MKFESYYAFTNYPRIILDFFFIFYKFDENVQKHNLYTKIRNYEKYFINSKIMNLVIGKLL